MKLERTIALLLALLPKIALAQTLSVEADRPAYLVGDVITLTVTGDSEGVADIAIWGELTYPAALTRTIQASQTQHTSNNGAQAWVLGLLGLRDGHATVFNQLCCLSPQSVDQVQIATVKLIAEAPGDVTVAFSNGLLFFGLTSAPGTSFTILPNLSIPPPLPGVPPAPGPSAPFAGGPSGSSTSYLIWPEAGNLGDGVNPGDTVGVLLDAQAAVDLSPDAGPIEVDPESFVVSLTHMCGASCTCGASSCTENVSPRVAIEAPAALSSVLVDQNGGSRTGIVLLFDLPAMWTQSSSGLTPGTDELLVGVSYEGQLLFDGKALLYMGNGGSPLSAGEFETVGALEQRPMLRFRPSWDAGTSEGFDPAWDIRAVEFVLHFTQPATGGDVANLSPTVNGDAATALTFVEPLAAPAGEKRWEVSTVAPNGFTIEDKGCAGAGDCYAGRWSLVDLALDKIPGPPGPGQMEGHEIFTAGNFSIESLVVIDSTGTEHVAGVNETFLRIHAINNRVESGLPPPTPSPLLTWPKKAYLGDTIAVVFNSEADTAVDPDAAYLDAAIENVVVHVDDPDGHRWTESFPAAVVELPAALGSKKVGTPPASQTGGVAFFDLPDAWPNSTPGYSLPATFDITVEYKGAATSGVASVEVVGIGGNATDFPSVASLDQLAKDRMLRLRPVWKETTPQEGFDPSWQIGSLEFLLRYTQSGLGEVTDLAALGNGEAVTALATASRLPDDGSHKLWAVHLIAPDGFGLPDAEIGSTGPSPVGRWALLDLLVDAQDNGAPASSVFSASEFAVEDVRVFDVDGSPLNPTWQGEPFFELTAVLPEPSAVVQLVGGALGVWVLGRRRRARARSRVRDV